MFPYTINFVIFHIYCFSTLQFVINIEQTGLNMIQHYYRII